MIVGVSRKQVLVQLDDGRSSVSMRWLTPPTTAAAN
jgi:hypothetical protein